MSMASTSPPTPPTQGWKVTTQVERTQVGQQGQLVMGVTVGFTTDSGLQGTVFVPETQYNAGTIRQLISQKVAAMSAVAGLTG